VVYNNLLSTRPVNNECGKGLQAVTVFATGYLGVLVYIILPFPHIPSTIVLTING